MPQYFITLYVVQFWLPGFNKYLNQVEKIQRMRMVENLEHLIEKKSMKLLLNLEIKNWHEV